MDPDDRAVIRLRIYLGEDKREGNRPLCEAIIARARRARLAGATVIRATQGFGRSTRLHSSDVLFSDDLPVIIEVVDWEDNVAAFAATLGGNTEIGLMTWERVELRGCRRLDP